MSVLWTKLPLCKFHTFLVPALLMKSFDNDASETNKPFFLAFFKWCHILQISAYIMSVEILHLWFCIYNKALQSVVFDNGQKMALRACYFIRTPTKALTYYDINRSQRHLLVALVNNWLEGPINYFKANLCSKLK